MWCNMQLKCTPWFIELWSGKLTFSWSGVYDCLPFLSHLRYALICTRFSGSENFLFSTTDTSGFWWTLPGNLIWKFSPLFLNLSREKKGANGNLLQECKLGSEGKGIMWIQLTIDSATHQVQEIQWLVFLDHQFLGSATRLDQTRRWKKMIRTPMKEICIYHTYVQCLQWLRSFFCSNEYLLQSFIETDSIFIS